MVYNMNAIVAEVQAKVNAGVNSCNIPAVGEVIVDGIIRIKTQKRFWGIFGRTVKIDVLKDNTERRNWVCCSSHQSTFYTFDEVLRDWFLGYRGTTILYQGTEYEFFWNLRCWDTISLRKFGGNPISLSTV